MSHFAAVCELPCSFRPILRYSSLGLQFIQHFCPSTRVSIVILPGWFQGAERLLQRASPLHRLRAGVWWVAWQRQHGYLCSKKYHKKPPWCGTARNINALMAWFSLILVLLPCSAPSCHFHQHKKLLPVRNPSGFYWFSRSARSAPCRLSLKLICSLSDSCAISSFTHMAVISCFQCCGLPKAKVRGSPCTG